MTGIEWLICGVFFVLAFLIVGFGIKQTLENAKTAREIDATFDRIDAIVKEIAAMIKEIG